MKKIGQKRARFYQKTNLELMNQIAQLENRWRSEWLQGFVHIETLTLTPESMAKVTTARLLGHAVILVPWTGNTVLLYADKLKEEKK